MPVSVDELNKSTTPCFSGMASKLGLTPRKLILELKEIAFSDIANHTEIAEGGELRFKTFEEQGKKRRAIQSLKEKTVITESKDGEKLYKTSTIEFKLYDKLDAIDLGFSMHGMKKPIKVDTKHTGEMIVNVVKFGAGDYTLPAEIEDPGPTSAAVKRGK